MIRLLYKIVKQSILARTQCLKFVTEEICFSLSGSLTALGMHVERISRNFLWRLPGLLNRLFDNEIRDILLIVDKVGKMVGVAALARHRQKYGGFRQKDTPAAFFGFGNDLIGLVKRGDFMRYNPPTVFGGYNKQSPPAVLGKTTFEEFYCPISSEPSILPSDGLLQCRGHLRQSITAFGRLIIHRFFSFLDLLYLIINRLSIRNFLPIQKNLLPGGSMLSNLLTCVKE